MGLHAERFTPNFASLISCGLKTLLQGEDDVFRNDVSQSASARAVRRLVQVSVVDVPTDIRRGAVVELMVNAGHAVVFASNVSSVRQLFGQSICGSAAIGRHPFWIMR